MAVGFAGTILNQILKLACRVHRPWVLDTNFSLLGQAREAAAGYCFPSGHTQCAGGTFGSIAAFTEKKALRLTCVILAVLVGFSRMYVGVHTPADVLTAAACALLLIFAFKRPVLNGTVKQMKLAIGVVMAMAVMFLIYVELWQFPQDMDMHNLTSGYKNAYTMMGCMIGVAIVYVADLKWINFSTEAKWWIQIIKVIAGLGLVLAVKEGLRIPLEMILPVYPARAVRYFLIVITAGAGWPTSFQYLSKIGVKK